MRDDIKAEKARKARGLVVWLHITILVTLIVLEERLDAGMFTIFVTRMSSPRQKNLHLF